MPLAGLVYFNQNFVKILKLCAPGGSANHHGRLFREVLNTPLTFPIRVPSGHQLDWLKSVVARAIVCATGVWWFQELGFLEGGQERKSPEALHSGKKKS